MHIKDFCKENLPRQQVRLLKKLHGDAMYTYRRIVTPEFILKKGLRKEWAIHLIWIIQRLLMKNYSG